MQNVFMLFVMMIASFAVGCSSPSALSLPTSVTVQRGRGFVDLGDIKLYSYRPLAHGDDDPIIFVMHGSGRNADDYRDAWVEVADKYNVMVLAPEFPEKTFPSWRGYNLGNMKKLIGGARDHDRWAFAFIEPLFKAVVQGVESRRTSFDMFGHSAGGQFVQRMVLFEPDAEIDRAVAANAGWYTLPTQDEHFPYGLASAPGPTTSYVQMFSKHLIIMLGELDNSAKAGGQLRKSRPAMRQGEGRRQRGEHFAAAAWRESKSRDLNLEWRVVVVPGVGHNYRKMAQFAAQYLYGKRLGAE